MQEKLRDCGARSSRPRHDNAQGRKLLINQLGRVYKCGKHYNRSTVLVIMENRNIESLAQPSLNFKATRCRNVFKVNSAKAGSNNFNGANDFVHVLGVEADGPRIDIGKFFEQRRLAFHDRHRCLRTNVS